MQDDKDGIGNDVVGKTRRARNQLETVDCFDANNNTALSEAASMIKELILLWRGY